MTGSDPTVITGRVAGCSKGSSGLFNTLKSSWTGRAGVGLGESASGLPKRFSFETVLECRMKLTWLIGVMLD